jgi:hypothetical protein
VLCLLAILCPGIASAEEPLPSGLSVQQLQSTFNEFHGRAETPVTSLKLNDGILEAEVTVGASAYGIWLYAQEHEDVPYLERLRSKLALLSDKSRHSIRIKLILSKDVRNALTEMPEDDRKEIEESFLMQATEWMKPEPWDPPSPLFTMDLFEKEDAEDEDLPPLQQALVLFNSKGYYHPASLPAEIAPKKLSLSKVKNICVERFGDPPYKLTFLETDKDLVEFVVKGFRGEIVDNKKFWEKLHVTLIWTERPEQNATLVRMFLDAQFAGGNAPNPAPTDYRDMEPRYSYQLHRFGKVLLENILGRLKTASAKATSSEG